MPDISAKGASGTIFTRFYPKWSKISDRENQSIFDDRERFNIKCRGKLKYFYKKKQSIDASIKFKNKAAHKIQCKI